MEMAPETREQFRRYGREGGRARAERMSPEARRTSARRAILRRWIRVRFGLQSFAALGLPGGRRIDQGLDDLAAEKETPDSLAVCLAWPRLERAGVPLPQTRIPDADQRLFLSLQQTEGDLAYTRYLAIRGEVESFANACRHARERHARERHARSAPPSP